MSTRESSAAIPGILNDAASQAPKSHGARESYAYVVGSSGSGKSTLIATTLRSDSVHKSRSAVAYSCIRKTGTSGKPDVAHICELPGSDKLSAALATKDKAPSSMPLPAFFLPAKSISTALVLIVADLSKPWSIADTCNLWLQRVRDALQEQYNLLSKRNSPLPEQLKSSTTTKSLHLQMRSARISAAAATSLNKPANGAEAQHTGIQVVICATKYDQLSCRSLQEKEVVARTLRSIAQINGAHLLYTAERTKASKASGADSLESEDSAKKLRALLTHCLFSGHDRKLPVETFKALSRTKTHPEVLSDGPVCVLHGTDTWDSIGTPRGYKGSTAGSSAAEAWIASLQKAFPPPAQPEPSAPLLEQLPPEAGIDAIVAQMQEQAQTAASYAASPGRSSAVQRPSLAPSDIIVA